MRDHYCNDENNNELCNYDDGDCCENVNFYDHDLNCYFDFCKNCEECICRWTGEHACTDIQQFNDGPFDSSTTCP